MRRLEYIISGSLAAPCRWAPFKSAPDFAMYNVSMLEKYHLIRRDVIFMLGYVHTVVGRPLNGKNK
jgi:hypothetical protein